MKSLKNIFLVFVVLAFNLKADSPLDDCGYFSGALSTRDACSGSGGTITFSGSANIYDNPDTALATCTVSTPQWVLDGTQTCQTADCTAIPGNTKSASITYNLAPASASLSSDPSTSNSDPSTSNTDITVSADTTLADYKYDVVTFNYAGEGKTATFDPSSDDEDLTIHQIASAWKIRFAVDEDIKIGSIASATYSSPFELITTTTPQNIEIETVDFKEGSTINLKAINSISMETFSVGRSSSSVTLEAPTITINSLTVSNSGSGIATIRLKADTINLGTLNMGQGAIVIVEPYTAGGNVTYKGNSITASSSSTMRLSSGDYYTDSLNIPGTSSASSIIAMDASSLVNLYINGNFAPGNNPGINSDGNGGNFGSLPATTMRIFINGNFSTGGGGTTLNAVIYVEGDATLGNPTYIRGALSAKHSISIGEGSKIYYDSSISDEIYAPCIDPREATSQLTGPFDAWDTFRSVSDRNISTKIANTAFNLTVAALNSAKTGLEAKASGVKARYRLLNTNTAAYLTDEQIFDANATAITSSFNAASASKNVKVEFKYCADYNGTHFILKPDTSCSADCSPQLKVTNNAPCFRKTYSTDAFALRPYALKVFATNEYKRAGEDFNITIKAVDETNNALNSGTVDGVNGVDDYNASLSDLEITSMFYTPTTAEMTRMQTNTGVTDVATCPNSGTFTLTNPSSLFIDGEQNATLKFNETGILDLYISENIGHEWAIVDADDTSDSNRTISPSIESFDKEHINKNTILAFVPYGFVTTADYNTTTGADWIYMHDINGSNSTFTTPKMGAYLSYSITAKGKDGNVLQNYTKTCFPDTSESRPYNASTDCPQVNGLKLNTTFDLYLNANINSSADANISLYTEDNASSAIYTPQKNATITVGSNPIQEWTSPKIFTNGIGKAKVYFNIDRKADVALNPITLRVEDVNTSTSWMLNAGSPKDFNGTILNTPKNFVYGRTHAAKQRYIKPSGTNTTTGTANIYFESYCFGAGCDKTLLPNGTASKNVDDIRWFINQNHNLVSDGNVTIVEQKGGTNSVTASDNPAGNPSASQLTYGGGKGYPYKTTMQNGASPWLIFDENNATATRNEFQVEFNSGADWSGAHDTNTTTKTDQAIRTNRRIMW